VQFIAPNGIDPVGQLLFGNNNKEIITGLEILLRDFKNDFNAEKLNNIKFNIITNYCCTPSIMTFPLILPEI